MHVCRDRHTNMESIPPWLLSWVSSVRSKQQGSMEPLVWPCCKNLQTASSCSCVISESTLDNLAHPTSLADTHMLQLTEVAGRGCSLANSSVRACGDVCRVVRERALGNVVRESVFAYVCMFFSTTWSPICARASFTCWLVCT